MGQGLRVRLRLTRRSVIGFGSVSVFRTGLHHRGRCGQNRVPVTSVYTAPAGPRVSTVTYQGIRSGSSAGRLTHVGADLGVVVDQQHPRRDVVAGKRRGEFGRNLAGRRDTGQSRADPDDGRDRGGWRQVRQGHKVLIQPDGRSAMTSRS